MRISDVHILETGADRGDRTFLTLRTDEGLVGLSEARLSGRTETLRAYLGEVRALYVVGADPFETERLVDRMVHAESGHVGPIAATAIALVEVACWDLVGKALNVPVYRLFGGAVRERIKACARDWDTAARTPDEFASAARRVVANGYKALRLDPFGPDVRGELSREELNQTVRRAEAVRAAVGPDVEVVVALEGRFPPSVAIKAARALERIEPAWVEEPAPFGNVQALGRISRQVRCPLAAGATLSHRTNGRVLFDQPACDVLRLDLTQGCGLSETRKIAAIAEMHAMTIALRNRAGPVATAANLHLAAVLPNFTMLEHVRDLGDEVDGNRGPVIVDGYFPLPQGPGLGVPLVEVQNPNR